VPYTFFDHTGDVGLTVRARSLALVFADAATALTDTMTDHRFVAAARSAAIELTAPAVDLLLVDWLNDLIYRFETDNLLVARSCVSVTDDGGTWRLQGTVSGESLDPARHPIRTLVKAATYHALEVTRVGEEWRATIVLDV
jgi:SHS2 domain-containing protein